MIRLLPKPLRRRVEYGAVLALSLFARLLPWRVAVGVGAALGGFVFGTLRYRRDVAMGNLRAVYGDSKSDAELVRIARESYRNIGRTFIEYLRFRTMKREEIEEMVEIDGLQHVDEALAAGKGGILVTAHYGSWELFGVALAQRGYPVHFLVARQHNAWVDRLINEHREQMGIGVIHTGVAARQVLRALQRNELVCILSDQDARRHGVFVNFLGLPASTPQGPAAFALKSGAPIVNGFITRTRGARHKGVFLPPLEVSSSGHDLEDIVRATQAYTDRITAAVFARPDHWFWPHRRWKTRPAKPGWRPA